MNPRSHHLIEKLLACAAVFLSLTSASPASQTRTNAPATAKPALTNATPVQIEIPKSVFLIPAKPQDGKDPFFPRSMRLFSSVVVKTDVQPTTTTTLPVELRLNGISGTADRRLAIINNQTFEANEEGEVPTNPGRARIRCLEIKSDSVLVQVGSQQRVLHLRPGF